MAMKKQVIGFLLVLMSVQAMAVGHPHNLFAARKQLKSKGTLSATTLKTAGKTTWSMMHQVKEGIDLGVRFVQLLQKVARR